MKASEPQLTIFFFFFSCFGVYVFLGGGDGVYHYKSREWCLSL